MLNYPPSSSSASKWVLPFPVMRVLHRLQSLADGLTYEIYADLYDPWRRRLLGRQQGGNDRLLVHIPKNAGLAIHDAIHGRTAGHRRFSDIPLKVKAQAKQIVFCTRDPFDKLVSSCAYLLRLRRSQPRWVRPLIIRPPVDFTQFVLSDQLEVFASHHYFFRSQYRYLEGIEVYAKKAIHLRFATLQADALEWFGTPIKRKNTGSLNEARSLFDPEDETRLRKRVRTVYRDDYEKLPAMLLSAGLAPPW